MAVIGEMLQLKIGNNTYSLPSGDHKWNDVELTKSAVAESSRSTVYATILTGTSVTTGYLMGATYSPSAGYIARYDANKYLYSDTPTTGDSSTKVATTAFVANAMSGVGAGTVTSVAVSNATNGGLSVSGSPITSSGTITIGHSNVLTSAQTTQAVYPIKIDKNGHISAYGSAVTIPTTAADVGAVPTTRTVNGKALSSDITLSASDVSALPSSTTIPTKTSDLTNDSGFVTTDEKLKTTALLSGTKYLIMGSTSGTAETKLHSTHLSFTSTRTFSIGSSGNKGTLRLYSSTSSSYTDLSNSATAARTITIPDATGTLALTSDIPTVPTNVSAFTNDAGYLTSYIETDPTVPSWAKASTKPTYTASEVGAAAKSHFHGYISSDGRILSNCEIGNGDALVIIDSNDSNKVAGTSGYVQFDGSTTNKYLSPKGTWESIPTKVSDLTNDSGYVTTDEKVKATAYTEDGTQKYLIFGENSGSAETKYYDAGLQYAANNTITTPKASLILGNTSLLGQVLFNKGNGNSVYTALRSSSSGDSNIVTLPNATGTIALTSDIPTVPTNVSAFTNDAGYLTSANLSGGLNNLVDGSAVGSVRGINTAAEDSSYTMGTNAFAEGRGTKASGFYSHAEGQGTIASGDPSHAEGKGTTASGSYSHAEGLNTTASGEAAHAEGYHITASGKYSHAEGYYAEASGESSHAEGRYTTASGSYSHAEGEGTTAPCKSQHVFGEHNQRDPIDSSTTRGTYVEIVGNGRSVSERSNARTLDWSGNETLQGSLTLGKGSANETTITAAQLKALIALLNQ